MDRLMGALRMGGNEHLYLKDPQSSDLGKRIVGQSILLIDEVGFNAFTFKKLGAVIGSNESSIYRYFESKHKLLLYLASWYWGWQEYKMVFATNGIADPERKLLTAVEIITQKIEEDNMFSHVNEVVLHRIVINEYSKSYHTKEVDQENADGCFEIYKRLINRLGEMVAGVDASYSYPLSLASTVLEGSMHQYFLSDHFPSLTNCNQKVTPTQYFTDMIRKLLNLRTHG